MTGAPFEIAGPTSPFAVNLDQRYLLLPEFTLESGECLTNAPIAFQTWGKLNAEGTNAVLVCHAISGNALATVWWDSLVGPGRVIDTNKFFVVCCNALGSPYGSASPVTRRGGEDVRNGHWQEASFVRESEKQTEISWWGSEFPQTTLRDDVQYVTRSHSAHKHVLDYLGIQQLVLVIGGSMGGMLSLEWPMCYPVRNPRTKDALPEAKEGEQKFVRAVALMASPARHSAWAIAWSEIQRKSITSDGLYKDGNYLLSESPSDGLSAARMCALITYRFPTSLERRFRRLRGKQNMKKPAAPPVPPSRSVAENVNASPTKIAQIREPQDREMFAVQSYLHHNGKKFVDRFDPNCYIHLTHKLDAHDAARERHGWASNIGAADSDEALSRVLRHLGTSPVGCEMIIFSITSDLLYPPHDQRFIHESVPGSQLALVTSSEGHDAFLLEFTQIERNMRAFVQKLCPDAKL